MADSLFTFIFLVSSTLIHLSNANPRVDIVARTCTETSVKENPKIYMSRYLNITKLMENDMYTNKYSYKKDRGGGGGKRGSKLFVFAQCLDDLTGDDCMTCFSQISDLLVGCLPSTGGRVHFDGCFMRYENYNFFHNASNEDDMQRCGTTIDDNAKHNDTVLEVLTKLYQKALDNHGYGEHQNTSDGVSVYGMAICWKILDPMWCDLCLESAIQNVLDCLPSTEGRALNFGCYIRYSDYEFANNPKARELQEAIISKLSYIIGVVTIISLAIWTGFFIGKITFRLQQNRQPKAIGKEIDSTLYKRRLPFLQFKYSTLEKATDHFNAAHRLGQGGFGEVFKGTLPDGREIAIKRLFTSGKYQNQEVYNEMDVISRAQHKNLVIFLGCCFTNRDSFLVYEYLANRSLNCILFARASRIDPRSLLLHPIPVGIIYLKEKDSEKKKELDWKKRLGVIIGTAEGLEYLHKDCQVRIVHRDIKASNILLDVRYKPKIADFGLARFNSCDQSLMSTAIAGTLGYMAPEYLAQGRLTEKVDVYSYGVLVLEIISGVQSTKFQSEESLDTIVTTAWKRFQSNTVSEIIDESLDIENVEEITRVVHVGLLCTQESPSLRPTMTMVIQMLQQKDIELPKPTKPPFSEECVGISESPSLPSDLDVPQPQPQHRNTNEPS